MKKTWPTRTGVKDSRPIICCKRFSYNENALYWLSSAASNCASQRPRLAEVTQRHCRTQRDFL